MMYKTEGAGLGLKVWLVSDCFCFVSAILTRPVSGTIPPTPRGQVYPPVSPPPSPSSLLHHPRSMS